MQGDEDEIEDPRLSLVKQLLEYKRYKECTLRLASRAAEWEKKWMCSYNEIPDDSTEKRGGTAAGMYRCVGSITAIFPTDETDLAKRLHASYLR